MASGKDSDQHLLNNLFLSDDHLGKFGADAGVRFLAACHGGNVFRIRYRLVIGHEIPRLSLKKGRVNVCEPLLY